jgi:acyl-CoA synthetase (AMP-forming)/AMP-acid ligase II
MEEGSEDFQNEKINPKEDLAVLPYTGGTTGMPKGVMLTHFNLIANAYQICVALGLSHADTVVGCMPMFHMAEFGLVNIMLTAGYTYVVMGMFNPGFLAENIEKYEGTFSWAVPPAINLLVNYLESVDRTYDWSYMKGFASGAWPIAPVLIERLKKVVAEKCNNDRLIHNQVWGMTEASPMVTTNPILRTDKSHTQGIPLSDVELKIIDLESGKELGINQSGEIVIRGPQIFKGYWKREKENQECWWYDEKGRKFFRTGDIGYIDEEGFLHFQDRVKEVIKYKGYTIAPF